MKRHELRQLALQALYQVDVGKADIHDAIGSVVGEHEEVPTEDVEHVRSLVMGTRLAVDEIDNLLETNVQGWRVDRIAKVEMNILRLAMYELLYRPSVDIATVVNEAVELAKEFSTEESGRFVNGVLARMLSIAQERRSQLGV